MKRMYHSVWRLFYHLNIWLLKLVSLIDRWRETVLHSVRIWAASKEANCELKAERKRLGITTLTASIGRDCEMVDGRSVDRFGIWHDGNKVEKPFASVRGFSGGGSEQYALNWGVGKRTEFFTK